MGSVDSKNNTFRTSELVKKHRINKTEIFGQQFHIKAKLKQQKDEKQNEEEIKLSEPSKKKKVLLYSRQGTVINDQWNVDDLQKRNIPALAKHRIVKIERTKEQRLLFKPQESTASDAI